MKKNQNQTGDNPGAHRGADGETDADTRADDKTNGNPCTDADRNAGTAYRYSIRRTSIHLSRMQRAIST